ncbi:hypothetical protein CYLTODRAFT_460435 [Cylindrobasidium torrendii FP15055 ss-10]|uniref:Uncharacterized protein n=1 Tax=Cylindrobasidium torrendii FP15055 ss-10 TaxID=1314674 RepID=A0A0D7ARD4_9AGAR|nr:hypothetical protein CYLTODRAFT_460435 [Cylindrobasidium torrendii FP15055 ss-10]
MGRKRASLTAKEKSKARAERNSRYYQNHKHKLQIVNKANYWRQKDLAKHTQTTTEKQHNEQDEIHRLFCSVEEEHRKLQALLDGSLFQWGEGLYIRVTKAADAERSGLKEAHNGINAIRNEIRKSWRQLGPLASTPEAIAARRLVDDVSRAKSIVSQLCNLGAQDKDFPKNLKKAHRNRSLIYQLV